MTVPDLRPWLLEDVLPFWADQAFDEEHGGYFGELSLVGKVIDHEAPKTCLVQARLLYTFSHAYLLVREAWALEAAQRTFEFMEARLWSGDGAWHATTPRRGGPAGDLFDLYDHAFVLFGIAWWFRVSGERRALARANETMAYLDRALADPVHGGWREDQRARLPRRQNPHMHLLEAMHALYEASGDEAWLHRARGIVSLFRTRFYDEATGTLREFLEADLSPAAETGHVREPGHHMEWVWLLLHHRRLTGDDAVLEPAEKLYQTACRHGMEASGLLIEAMTPEGAPLTRSTLLWPQTEALKAALARHEFLGADPAEADGFVEAMFRHHIPDGGPLWINQLSPEDAPLSSTVPTRLLYHLTLAVAEHIRLRSEHGMSAPRARR